MQIYDVPQLAEMLKVSVKAVRSYLMQVSSKDERWASVGLFTRTQ
jgi:hypothetical protein